MGIFVKNHARAIAVAGGNIKVLAFVINHSNKFWENRSKLFVDENGVETQLIEVGSRMYKLLMVDLFFQKAFIKKYSRIAFPDFKPDIIHSNVLYPAGILGDHLAQRRGIPHVMTEHWSKAADYLKNGWHRPNARKAMERLSCWMPVSYALADKVQAVMPVGQVAVVPNAVDTDLYSFAGEAENKDVLEMICCANWVHPKRPDIIFEALEKYVSFSEKKVKLTCIGNGDLILLLRERKWSFETEFHGFMKAEEIVPLFKRSHFLLHASGMETFSLAVAEALCCGLPVIASNVGAVPELIHENNGLTVENHVESWRKAIGHIQERVYDRAGIANEIAKKVSLQEVGRKYMDIYRSVLRK